jgi:hypothetical protein
MIDFIKVCCTNKSHTHILKKKFNLKTDVNDKTGETSGIYYGKIGEEYSLKLFPSGRISIMGSLHKAYNNGTNETDFTFSQVKESINSFCDVFGLSPKDWVLENMEYGVNLTLPYSPEVILNNIVSLRTGDTFSTMSGGGLCCRKYEYRYKIYDKSRQFDIKKPILRFEIHDDKMRRKPMVKTLQDLLNSEVWNCLSESLLKHSEQVIFTDVINRNELLSGPHNKLVLNLDRFNNPRFWKELEPYQRNRSIQKLNTLLTYGKYQTSATFKNLLQEKLNYLLTTATNSPFNY